jgi:biofilm protein TabA
MIYDRIENRGLYKDLPGIREALEYLAGLGLEIAPKEKTFLDGDKLIANPLAYTTKSAYECVFEAHRINADVHFILDGEERIAISSTENATETKPYNADTDTVYYEGSADSDNIMKPGYFMVCFPQDIHRTGELVSKPCNLKKIVVKVKM